SFAPPPLSRLFLWTGQVVPWVIGSHFGAHVRRAALEFRRAAEPHPPEAPSKTVPREAAPWGVAAAAPSPPVLAALAALAPAWAPARCQRLAVVAHSQGAAVACLALQREVPGNLRLLLTLGSGLRKLDELRQFGNPRSHQRKLAGMVTISLSLVVFLSLALTRP